MAAKGSVLKGQIMQKILETFPGSFLYNDGKEVRINGIEAGQEIQIKVTFTTAKEAVEGGSPLPIEISSTVNTVPTIKNPKIEESVPLEPTEEEKQRLSQLLNSLGLV